MAGGNVWVAPLMLIVALRSGTASSTSPYWRVVDSVSRGAGALVALHTLPRRDQRVAVMDEIEHIVEPAAGVGRARNVTQ
jgi:hypothetical protein